MGDATEVNFEKVAAPRPDLILAIYSGLTEEDLATTYSRHSQRVVPRLDALGLLNPRAIAAISSSARRNATWRSISGMISVSASLYCRVQRSTCRPK